MIATLISFFPRRPALLLLGLAAAFALLAPAAPAQDLPEVVRELLERAENERASGRLDDAVASYREARQLGPGVVEIYVALGALEHQRGNLEASLEAFESGLKVLPDDRNLLFNAAVVALALERFPVARGYADQALAKNPKDVDLLLLAAAICDRQGERSLALEQLLKADKLRPGDAQIQFKLGNLYHALERGPEAVEAYRKALKKDPGLLRAQLNLGTVLFSLGRNQEALEAYRIALAPAEKALAAGNAVDKVHVVAFANLAAIHRQLGQWKESLQAYFNALQLDPKRRDLLAGRAYALLQLGQLDQAAADYQDALADDPKSAAALLGLGLIESRRGRCAPAVDFFERGFASFDSAARLQALEPLANCYVALGRGQEAEKAFRSLLEGRQDDPELLFALGRLLRRQGSAAEAETWLTKAAGLRPEHLGAALELLALAEGRSDTARVVQLGEDLLRRHSSRGELWPLRQSLALLYLQNGRAAEALPHFAALEANQAVPASDRAELSRCFGLALAAAGKYEEARKKLRGAAQTGANVSGALAYVEAMAGKSDAALAALGGASDPGQRANLGLLSWSIGRGEAARPHLEAALAAGGPIGTAARVALADLALRRGELAAATEGLAAVQPGCGGKDGDPAALAKVCAHSRALWQNLRREQAQNELSRAVKSGAPSPPLRQLAEELVAAAPAKDPGRPFALLLRGTARLLAGDADGAAADFSAGLEAGPGELEKSLRGNLAVALARQGNLAEARRLFEAGRDAASQLDLGILLESDGKTSAALPYYLAYLEAGGERRQEVEAWVKRLREVSP